MTELLSQTHTIRSEQVDVHRRLRPSALFLMLQQIALDHCKTLGLDTDVTLHRNLLWVVTRYHVEINRLPRYEETVTLETWPGATRRVLFPRYFRMKDADGSVLLRVSSVWVLIDGATRSMISPKAYNLEPIEGRVEGDELPYNVPPETIAPQRTEQFTVPYSFLDLNGHMNNTRYFDLCGDLIADETEGLQIKSISAEYQNEIHYKETVAIGIGRRDMDYTFTGTADRPCFRIGLSFAAREDA